MTIANVQQQAFVLRQKASKKVFIGFLGVIKKDLLGFSASIGAF